MSHHKIYFDDFCFKIDHFNGNSQQMNIITNFHQSVNVWISWLMSFTHYYIKITWNAQKHWTYTQPAFIIHTNDLFLWKWDDLKTIGVQNTPDLKTCQKNTSVTSAAPHKHTDALNNTPVTQDHISTKHWNTSPCDTLHTHTHTPNSNHHRNMCIRLKEEHNLTNAWAVFCDDELSPS